MEALLTQAWNLGGFAVAFIVAMMALNTVWRLYTDSLKAQIVDKVAELKILIDTVAASSAVIARSYEADLAVVAALKDMQEETRAKTAEILQSIQNTTSALADRATAATAAAEVSKTAALTAQLAASEAALAAQRVIVRARKTAKELRPV